MAKPKMTEVSRRLDGDHVGRECAAAFATNAVAASAPFGNFDMSLLAAKWAVFHDAPQVA